MAGGRSGSYKGLSTEWATVRARCGLNDVRLHDLRHSYASSALAAGVPLATVGKILGHKRARTTERYGHLSQDHVAAANDVVGAALAAAIEKATKRQRRQVTPPWAPPMSRPLSEQEWVEI